MKAFLEVAFPQSHNASQILLKYQAPPANAQIIDWATLQSRVQLMYPKLYYKLRLIRFGEEHDQIREIKFLHPQMTKESCRPSKNYTH